MTVEGEQIRREARRRAQHRPDAGILVTLEGEHAEVDLLMNKVLSAEGDTSTREQYYPSIRDKLIRRGRGEREVFYPACERVPELTQLTQGAIADNERMERRLAELDDLETDSSAWRDTFERLHDDVGRHFDREESRIFPKARAHLGNDVLMALDEAYEEAKRRADAGALTPHGAASS